MIEILAGALAFSAGVAVGVFVSRTSGEAQARALQAAWPFAVEMLSRRISAEQQRNNDASEAVQNE